MLSAIALTGGCDIQAASNSSSAPNSEEPAQEVLPEELIVDVSVEFVPEVVATSNALQVLYVDAAVSGPVHDGSAWCTAFAHLQDALDAAIEPGGVAIEIRVAQGTYRPDQGVNQILGDRSATIQLLNGVALRGGYPGCLSSDPDVRNPQVYASILSGDLLGDDSDQPTSGCCIFHQLIFDCDDMDCRTAVCADDPNCCESSWYENCVNLARVHCPGLCTNGDNSTHVVSGSYTDLTAVLDGFVISGGSAEIGQGVSEGGGMSINYGSPTVSNCVFRANAALDGGAVHSYFGGPVFRQCRFVENLASLGAAGVFIVGGSAAFLDCVFGANRADACCGGGLQNQGGNVELTRCRFEGNAAEGGGGVENIFDAIMVLSNCTFTGNTALHGGGALHNRADSMAILTNCTISKNTVPSGYGGGIRHGSSLFIENSVLWDNSDLFGQVELSQIYSDASAPSVNFSCIQGWTGAFGGIGNIGEDPLILDADGDDNVPGTQDDELRLSPDSPCIQSGDPAVQLQDGQHDADLHARVLCGRLDMGAFEFGIGDFDCDRDIDLSDFSAWEPCFLGPAGLHYPPHCESNDFEFDNDIDLIDFAEWQRAFATVR